MVWDSVTEAWGTTGGPAGYEAGRVQDIWAILFELLDRSYEVREV